MNSLDDLKNDGIPVTNIVDPNFANSRKAETKDPIPTASDDEIKNSSARKVIDVATMTSAPAPVELKATPLDVAMGALTERTESVKEEMAIIADETAQEKEIEAVATEDEDDANDEIKSLLSDDEEPLDEVEAEYANMEKTIAPAKEISKNEESRVTGDVPPVNFDELESTGPDLGLDLDDFSDLDLDEDAEEEKKEKEIMENLQNSITEKIVPISKKLNISNFQVVSSEPISMNAALEKCHAVEKTGDWVLNATKRPITFKQFSGSEIETIANNSRSSTNLNNLKKVYRELFNHIPEEKRPASFEVWLKTTSYLDIDHLYMAVYNVAFDGANHIPYTCNQCNNMWITENEDVMEMVKFKDEAVKATWTKIRNMETDPSVGLYSSGIIPISESLAFGFKEPSIYDIVVEPSSLDMEFRSKYANVINMVSYIDNIYIISTDTQTLKPIQYKVYPNNISKTFKSKILAYSKFIGILTSDQYNTIIAYMREINKKDEEVQYILPEVTCPKCGAVIKEEVQSAESILFTRHQLTALLTI